MGITRFTPKYNHTIKIARLGRIEKAGRESIQEHTRMPIHRIESRYILMLDNSNGIVIQGILYV